MTDAVGELAEVFKRVSINSGSRVLCLYRARLKAIGVRGGASWGGWVGWGWGLGGAAEGPFLVFLHSL